MNLQYSQKPKALLVDMDGTLIDTLPMLYDAYMSFLKSYGILGTTKEFEEFMGPSLSEIIIHLKQRYRLTENPSALIDIYKEGLKEAYEQGVQFFPYALETILYAKKQNIKLALVSSSEKQFVKAFVQGADLSSLFDCIIAYQAGASGKPHPDLYLKALESLKCDAAEAVAVEDSINGVRAATGAKIYTFWIKHNTFFNSSFAPNLNAIPSAPQEIYYQIEDWRNILNWLKGVCGE